MNLRNKTLTIYSAKCVTGILLCFIISIYLQPWLDYAWCLISMVLVLSPEGKDSVELAQTRIKANLVGAATGIVVLLMQVPSPWNVAAGAVISLFLCDRLKLNTGARSTLAAMVIILLQPEGTHVWDSALSRVLAVIAGCILGLMITHAFHFIFKIKEPALNSETDKKEQES